MPKIPNGCVLVARKITDSEIWTTKPAWWSKVWIYILMKVNHADNKRFARGQNFFTYETIYRDCSLRRDRCVIRSIHNVISWLKQEKQIMTLKTGRGVIITVSNYKEYQNIDNYRHDRRNDDLNDTRMTLASHMNDTKNKNGKNEKMKEEKPVCAFFDLFWKAYPSRNGKKLEKAICEKIFISIPLTEHSNVVKAAENYAKSDIAIRGFAKDPKRFLRNEFWKDWLEPEKVVPISTKKTPAPAGPDLFECVICHKKVVERERRTHYDKHKEERDKTPYETPKEVRELLDSLGGSKSE